jgi:probable F420-dependent oxidoreductase
MVRPFRFGVQARVLDDRDALVAASRQVEQLGYAELYSYDHIGAVDPFVPLVIAAEATERLRIGPLVVNNELHHPALLARTAATVDRLSSGRLVLGLGTGYAQAEHDSVGIELRPPGRRVDRFEASLDVLRQLLDTGRCHHTGTDHHLAVDDLGVRPVQPHVPFLVGGHGRRVVEIAARRADIFQYTGLTHGEGGAPSAGGFDLEALDLRTRWLEEAAGDRGPDLERSVLVQMTRIGPDVGGQLAELADRFGVDASVIDATPFVLLGSVEQVVDKLERLRERYGISHVVVRDAEGFAPVAEALTGR